ncbi:MAG: hypothetical protein BMS9Abin20_0365 [Acidimicrobiia bacterium]|nr:MAG: hypothetical protein BMS9Abin20_0365 [Acidimicrobiia bacterium]
MTMVWYNNPESVRAIQDARHETFMGDRNRLMRLVRDKCSID